jgi:hypothetical protein
MAEIQFVTDITKFSERTKKLLADNAEQFGITAEEYLIMRGGIDPVTRKYGDSYDPNVDLTPDEYTAAVAGKTGDAVGKAINAATEAKTAKFNSTKEAPTPEPTIVEEPTPVVKPTPVVAPTPTPEPAAVVETTPVATVATSTAQTGDLPEGVTVISTYADPVTGDVTAVLSNGTTKVLAKSGEQDTKKRSAYDLLYQEYNDLGVGALVPELKTFIEDGIDSSEFTLRLRQTEAYKKRFAANAQRVAKGLRALSPAEYISKEDFFQDVMQRYGLPESYYARGEMGRQEGFEKLIANNISDTELEERISTAQKRVINANPEVTQALKAFYPDISNADILAYSLDPTNAIENIKRKVTVAEIGGAAVRSGLNTSLADAEYLQRYGVTKAAADEGYGTIAGGLQRGSQLAAIYGEDPYTQSTAEQEVFNVPGAQDARKQRQKITGLEKAAFSGQTGISSSSLSRDRAGGY